MAPDILNSAFALARRKIAPYAERTSRFTAGEVLAELWAAPLPGHTPGHTGYLLKSRGERLLIWADTMSVPAVQSLRPGVSLLFDTDPALAVISRRGILERAVREDLLVVGSHLPFPAFSRVARAGDGYVVQPETWSVLT